MSLPPRIVGGERRGQTLRIGVARHAGSRSLELDAESFASGPFGGRILVGTDDGAESRLYLVDAAVGCEWPITSSADVIRRATLTPAGDAIIEYRLDRQSRADLGVWRRPLRSGSPTLLLPPLTADGRFGKTWSTELAWSIDGSSLAVQSCGEAACRTRVVDTGTGRIRSLADPELGTLVGLDARRLVVYGACRGLPCPLHAVNLVDGRRTLVDALAGDAIVTRDASGRGSAVFVRQDGGLRSVDLLDGTARDLPADGADRAGPGGQHLLATPARSGVAADLRAGWVLVASDDGSPRIGPDGPRLRQLFDGRTARFDEVQP